MIPSRLRLRTGRFLDRLLRTISMVFAESPNIGHGPLFSSGEELDAEPLEKAPRRSREARSRARQG